MITTSSVSAVWNSVLKQDVNRLRRLVEAAHRDPLLSSLYPFFSANWLRFTREFKFPYEFMPYVSAEGLPDAAYQVLDADHSVLVTGELNVVIPTLSDAVRNWVAQHPEIQRRGG